MFDAAVVGGGIVGTAIAYHLTKGGARTILIDRVDPGRATNAGAGILSPETSTSDSERWFDLAVAAVGYYPTLIGRLEAEQSGPTGYGRCGTLVVAVGEDEVAPFEAARGRIRARQQRRGRPDPADLVDLDPAEAQQLFPPLAPVQRALYYRYGARVDGRLLTDAMQRAAVGLGLTVKQADVTAVSRRNGTVAGVEIAGEMIPAGAVVIAGGAWSAHFARQLNVNLPIRPQRGQILHLDLPETDTTQWPVVTAFHGHYLVPWADGRVAAGATREPAAGFAAQVTAGGLHEVLTEALRVAPGLASGLLRETRVGLRPVAPDGLPVLGRVPELQGIYVATGHGPTGLQLGPYSGKLIADLMMDIAPDTDLTPFAIERFSSP